MRNSKELLRRFAIATVLLSLVLTAAFFYRAQLADGLRSALHVERLSADMTRRMGRLMLLLEQVPAVATSAGSEREHLIAQLGEQTAKLQTTMSEIGASDDNRTSARFSQLFFHAGLGLYDKMTKLVAESVDITEIVRRGEPVNPERITLLSKTLVPELSASLDTTRQEAALRANELEMELRRVYAMTLAFVMLLFLATGFGIILPTSRLLKEQDGAHAAIMASANERNAELALSQENLRLQKRILQSVLDNIGEGVIVFQRDGALLLQNPAAQKLFPDVEPGTHVRDWQGVVGMRHAETLALLETGQAPASRVFAGEALSGELFAMRPQPDAEPCFLAVSGRPMVDERGESQGCVLSFHDVSEAVRSEMELRRATAEAEAASQSKSEFLANVSHEIRTPMTAIIGYADMLLAPGMTAEQRHRNVQIIRRNGRILMRLIDDILDVSKIEAGKLEIKREKTALQGIVSEVHSLLLCRAQENHIALDVRFEGALPALIDSDPIRLRQILINIVGNAIKFTQHGGVTVTVRYQAAAEPNRGLIEFEVRDTGCGIPREKAERLFQPFVQIDTTTTRRFGGSGLGLVLARRLARALGGDLWLQKSAPGAGSTFVATIDPGPIEPSDLVTDLTLTEVLVPSDGVLPEGSALAGLKILVVEDSPENRELFACYLEAAGAAVTTACDGVEAVEKALADKYDAVVMDIQMPRMDGYQAVAALKERQYPAPIIALTAHAMSEERRRCSQAGFDERLVKPIDASALVEAVGRMARIAKSYSKPKHSGLVDLKRLHTASPRIREIVARFAGNLGDETAAIEEAWRSGDVERVRGLTHRLKGTSGNCGFTEVMNAALAVEDALDGGLGDGEVETRLERLSSIARQSMMEFDRLRVADEIPARQA